MIDLEFDLLAFATAAFNVLRLVSYWPQIVAVARDQNGASSISFTCWSIWIAANGSTAVYAWVKVADLALTLMNGFNAACCTAVVILAAHKRIAFRRRMQEPSRDALALHV